MRATVYLGELSIWLWPGEPIKTSKGQTREITGVVLELTNPRARLSRTESRGKPFSCIGEPCWYFNGTDETSFIVHYLTHHKKADEGGHIFGAYPNLMTQGIEWPLVVDELKLPHEEVKRQFEEQDKTWLLSSLAYHGNRIASFGSASTERIFSATFSTSFGPQKGSSLS